jgi:predicted TIM-barrel fold metal-dependent hydrolase
MPKRIFVDAHCHFFNLDDIPIYPTIMGYLPVNTFLLLGLSIRQLAVKALQDFKPFIQFFERSRRRNLERYSREILNCASKDNFDEIILTPLIMDFSKITDSVEEVSDQLEELLAAIDKAEATLSSNKTKVLPFFGLDLRHFDACAGTDEIKEIIDELSTCLFDFDWHQDYKATGNLDNGTIAGFKLYPSIGFSPYPDNTAIRNRYLEFYKLCADTQIPITTHCQSIASGAYKSADNTTETLNAYLDPVNWSKVLQSVENLKINFGHFGGDKVLRDTFLNQQTYPKEQPSRTWTWEIVKMLKQYPHTYADISAFDFREQSWLDAFGAMLILDENGFYDAFVNGGSPPLNKLSDKILWGSDWPMVIDDWDDSYQQLWDKFKESLNFARIHEDKIKISNAFGAKADEIILPDSTKILEKIVSLNPQRFLFGE